MELNLIYDKLSFSQLFADARLIKGGYVCQEQGRTKLVKQSRLIVFSSTCLEVNYVDQSLKGLSKSSICPTSACAMTTFDL